MATAVTAHAADTLKVGAAAPDFTLPYATKDTIAQEPLTLSLEAKKGPILLAFYPADWSGGCTRELCSFRDDFGQFAELGVRIWGISGDYVYSHHEWAKHHNLPFELLADHDHTVGKLYDSYNPEYGQNRRAVYVIGSDGKIAFAKPVYSVRTPDDYEELKKALAALK